MNVYTVLGIIRKYKNIACNKYFIDLKDIVYKFETLIFIVQ